MGSGGVTRVSGRPLFLYRFRYALFQHYLYNSLSEPERMLLHGEVGQALEALYGEHVADIAPQPARHLEEAGDHMRAAKYCTLAGATASRSYAYDEALAHCDAALHACDRCSMDKPETLARWRNTYETRDGSWKRWAIGKVVVLTALHR